MPVFKRTITRSDGFPCTKRQNSAKLKDILLKISAETVTGGTQAATDEALAIISAFLEEYSEAPVKAEPKPEAPKKTPKKPTTKSKPAQDDLLA